MLYPHQKQILSENPVRKILAWATSLGKTLALVSLANQNEVSPLVICPKSLKKRWMRESFNKKFLVMTKEEFRKHHKEVPRFEAVIVDEIHHFSGKSQMMKSLLWYVNNKRPRFVWGASATPYRSTPWNVYYLAGIMGLNWNWKKFRDVFFKIRYLGKRQVWVPDDTPPLRERLMVSLKKFCDVVSAEDAGMPPEDVFEEEVFVLTSEQRSMIKDLKLEESNPVVRYGKEHQIAQGFLNGNEFEDTALIKNEKIPRICELAEEHPSMLIFARYTAQIEAIRDALQKDGHTVYVLTGATKNRQEIIEAVNGSDDAILIAQTALGEGWEAPKFDFIIFASLPWSFVDYTQCIGRASRVNIPKRRTYLTLTVEDSIDEKVKEALENKQDFHLELYKPK